MAKVWSFQKKLTVSASTVVALGVLLTAIPKTSDYITLPETTKVMAGQIQTNQVGISDVQRWIQVQQEANELQRQWQQQQQQYYSPQPQYPNAPVYQEPPPREICWDDYEQWEYDCHTGQWL